MINKTAIFLLLLFQLNYSFAQDNAKDNQLENIEERLTTIELNNLMNNTSFYGSFWSTYENLNIDPKNDSSYNKNIFKSVFQLNLKSKINSRLNFYGGIMGNYFWNDNLYTNQQINDDGRRDSSRSSLAQLSRAYFNYKLNSSFSLTVGRIPGAFGPPEHLKNSERRTGTFTTHSFSLFTDVVSVSWKRNNLFSDDDPLVVRFIYTPMINASRNNVLEQQNTGNIDGLNNNVMNHEAFSIMAEHDSGKTSWYKNLSSIIQAHYIKFGGLSSVDSTGAMEGQSISAGQTVVSDTSTYRTEFSDEVMAQMIQITSYFEFSKIFNSNTDFYFSYQRQWLKDFGTTSTRRVGGGTVLDNMGNDVSAFFPAGNTLINESRVLTKDGEASAESLLVGFKTDLNKKNYYGFEYSYLSDAGINFALQNTLSFNIYQQNGKGYHLYYGYKPFKNESLIFRFGVQKSNARPSITYDHTNERTIDSIYTLAKINF